MAHPEEAGSPYEAGERILDGVDMWDDLSPPSSRAVGFGAVATFGERGFHGSTIKHIAERTGLSTAALYLHFRSKEHLLHEIALRGHRAALEIVHAGASAYRDPALCLQTLVYALSRWHAEEGATARVIQYELPALESTHLAEVQELRRRTEDVVRGVVASGVAGGAFDVADHGGAAAAVLSLCIDVSRWYRPEGRRTPDAIGQLHAELTSRMLATRGA